MSTPGKGGVRRVLVSASLIERFLANGLHGPVYPHIRLGGVVVLDVRVQPGTSGMVMEMLVRSTSWVGREDAPWESAEEWRLIFYERGPGTLPWVEP